MLPNAITYLSFNLIAFLFSFSFPSLLLSAFFWRGFILRNLPKLKITEFFSWGEDEKISFSLNVHKHTKEWKKMNSVPSESLKRYPRKKKKKIPISFSLFTLFTLIMLDGCYDF